MKRKRLIDKKLQLKTSFAVIRFYFISFFIVLALLAVHTALTDKKITGTVKDLKGAVSTEQNIVNAFIKYADMTSNSDLQLKSQKISEDHNESVQIIEDHISVLTGLIKSGFIVIIIITSFMVIMGLILFYYLIRLTHTISGPIYVMTQQIQDIIEGKEPAERPLRQNDQLKDFYEQFISMAKKIREEKQENSRP
jgi:nitrogen fixation/metabolism regulation signal transduction histidine kinase